MFCTTRVTSKPRYVYALCPLHLHRQIREARPKLQRRRLRLIHAGRLLNDGTQLPYGLVRLKSASSTRYKNQKFDAQRFRW
jgi:hypothetical protein